MLVMREVRFSLGGDAAEPVTNSYAGWPSAVGVQSCVQLRAVLAGEPDATTGYLVNIVVVDQLLRQRAIPLIQRLCTDGCSAEWILRTVADDLLPHAPAGTRWAGLHLASTPYLTYSVEFGVSNMVHLTQTFEFAAAHRLHRPQMSEQENRDYFGKCNNPNGHGHNYVLEVTVAGDCRGEAGRVLPVVPFEQVVKQRVIDRFDHKHLNLDCAEFRELNPSVENIARVIWGLLEGHVSPAKLARVRVWETSKTYAEFAG